MTRSLRRASLMQISPMTLLLPPMAVTVGLWLTSPNFSQMGAVACAFLLLLMPWGAFLSWRHGNLEGLPVFAMVGGAYWVYFGLALLWGPRELSLVSGTFVPTESAITETMYLTLAGVIAFWLGMRIPVTVWVPAHLPDILNAPGSWWYVRAVLLGGIALKLYPDSAWLLGAGGRQAMITLATVVPNVAFVLLLCRYLDGRSNRADRVVLVIAVLTLVMGGLASGWLGSVAGVAVLYGTVVMLKRRNIPWLAVGIATVTILFLQVGKEEFRRLYWAEVTTDATSTERARFWLENSMSRWQSAFESDDGASAQNLASESLNRASLLTQVAHVMDMTPSDVPFQGGATYQYLSVTLIPRFLWPDKPSVNDANRFYQVEYGLTTERGLDGVSIAVGSLAEGYINFGWPGAIGIMFGVGILLGLYERTFGLAQSSSLFMALGLALIPQFLAIESQLGQYLGGVLQQTALAAAVFLPVANRRGVRREAGARTLPSVRTLQEGQGRA